MQAGKGAEVKIWWRWQWEGEGRESCMVGYEKHEEKKWLAGCRDVAIGDEGRRWVIGNDGKDRKEWKMKVGEIK